MTPQEIIEKEPRLQEVVAWLEKENENARKAFFPVYYHEMWPLIKRKITPLVGWDAAHPEIKQLIG